MIKIVWVLFALLFSGCATQYDINRAWEEGVVYGARTLYNGDLDEDRILTMAYRLKYEDWRNEKELQDWIINVNKN